MVDFAYGSKGGSVGRWGEESNGRGQLHLVIHDEQLEQLKALKGQRSVQVSSGQVRSGQTGLIFQAL